MDGLPCHSLPGRGFFPEFKALHAEPHALPHSCAQLSCPVLLHHRQPWRWWESRTPARTPVPRSERRWGHLSQGPQALLRSKEESHWAWQRLDCVWTPDWEPWLGASVGGRLRNTCPQGLCPGRLQVNCSVLSTHLLELSLRRSGSSKGTWSWSWGRCKKKSKSPTRLASLLRKISRTLKASFPNSSLSSLILNQTKVRLWSASFSKLRSSKAPLTALVDLFQG